MKLPFAVERCVVIRAERSTVFRFFTDPALFARWWGEGSTIDGRPGGAVKIRYPNGETASGCIVEMVPDQSVVFTYGYDSPGKPIAAGASRVRITLEDDADGTRLFLVHEVADAATRDAHVPGWRYQLALFANAAADAQHATLGERIDGYFASWQAADAPAIAAALAAVALPQVSFHDRFSCTAGIEDLAAHILAGRAHMPGLVLKRDGEPLHCQGVVLAGWVAEAAADGRVLARGTNVFELAADGRIAAVTGLWR